MVLTTASQSEADARACGHETDWTEPSLETRTLVMNIDEAEANGPAGKSW
jgi:hypothetical protein